jgi:hypothetical protein
MRAQNEAGVSRLSKNVICGVISAPASTYKQYAEATETSQALHRGFSTACFSPFFERAL